MWTQHYIHFPHLASHSTLLIEQIISIAFFLVKSFRNRVYIAQHVIFNVTKSQLNLNLALVSAVCIFYWEVLFGKVPSALCTLNTHTCHLSSYGPLISMSFWFAFILICIDTPQKSNVMLHFLLICFCQCQEKTLSYSGMHKSKCSIHPAVFCSSMAWRLI